MKKHSKQIHPKKKTHTCIWCGKPATVFDFDPFFEQLPELKEDDEPEVEEWWCEECYQQRLYDI